ncbi:MAG: T9SS C-terminal target domain-containing protein [Ignavibacteriae bacterium]|nr:MAG: T9SS C-terminal target domain-containing protein [Ignavibacteriota bacterium]
MKKKFTLCSGVLFLVFMLLLLPGVYSQTPMYYTNNTGTSNNAFPFNMSPGKAINVLFQAGEFIYPTPLAAGYAITSIYVRSATTGTRTYTNMHVLFAQDSLSNLTMTKFYEGIMDTVYTKTSVTLSSTMGQWMLIELNHPFPYDPTKSLIVFMGQCGYSGTGTGIYNSTKSGIRRVWSVGGCPFTPYASGDGALCDFGVDVVPWTGIEPPAAKIPESFTLGQNYPNPFNPSTKIEFSVPEEGYITIDVFDMLGRNVQTLASNTYKPGKYAVEFDADKLAGGVYYYTLRSGNFTDTKKMVLIK